MMFLTLQDEEGQVDMALVKYDPDMDADTEVDSNMSMTECGKSVRLLHEINSNMLY